MWQALGIDLSLWARVFIGGGFFVVLILGAAYAVRRFGARALGAATGGRGRQPRLAVIDSAMVDARRQLLLIRRDNVEHLIMTGGPTDIVIEPNIVRATAPAREAAPARVTPTLADTLPRAVPLADGGNWPLQPDVPPPPPVRAEPPIRAEAPMRPQRAAPPPPAPPPPAIDADADAHEPDWSAREEPAIESEPPPRIEPRAEPPLRAEPMLRAVPDPEPSERPQRAGRMKNSERLAGLAADLSRSFMDTDMSPQPRRPAEPRRPPPPPVQPVPSVPPLSEAEEQNLTEMAQRLESALQRPHQIAEPTLTAAAPALRAVELPRIEPVPPAGSKPRPEPSPTPKHAFGTLEQEMASLLGHSPGKT